MKTRCTAMRAELMAAFELAANLPADELPFFIGELEIVRCIAVARLTTPAPTPPDQNLEVPETAHRLGVSPDFLYRNHRRFPFTRRIGRKLLFSSRGLEDYLRRQS